MARDAGQRAGLALGDELIGLPRLLQGQVAVTVTRARAFGSTRAMRLRQPASARLTRAFYFSVILELDGWYTAFAYLTFLSPVLEASASSSASLRSEAPSSFRSSGYRPRGSGR